MADEPVNSDFSIVLAESIGAWRMSRRFAVDIRARLHSLEEQVALMRQDIVRIDHRMDASTSAFSASRGGSNSSRLEAANGRIRTSQELEGQGRQDLAEACRRAKLTEFRIYRYDPDTGDNPRVDTYFVDRADCGPMILDGLIWIKSKIDPTLTFRRSCREGICGSCAMNIGGGNTLACTQRHGRGEAPDQRSIPCRTWRWSRISCPTSPPSMPSTPRSSPGCTPQTREPEKEWRQSEGDRAKLDGLYECILCACCSTSCPSYWWNGERYLGPAALLQAYRWLIDSRDEATGERLDHLEDPFRLYRCHTIMNCAQACPKGLNPAKAIAEIKKMMVERRV